MSCGGFWVHGDEPACRSTVHWEEGWVPLLSRWVRALGKVEEMGKVGEAFRKMWCLSSEGQCVLLRQRKKTVCISSLGSCLCSYRDVWGSWCGGGLVGFRREHKFPQHRRATQQQRWGGEPGTSCLSGHRVRECWRLKKKNVWLNWNYTLEADEVAWKSQVFPIPMTIPSPKSIYQEEP